MITIIDYGLGNVSAYMDIFKKLNIQAVAARSLRELDTAEKVILPGVGSFDWAMELLNQSGMRERLDELVLAEKCPVLGVCVGMQIMANHSEEGSSQGLGWIPGRVEMIEQNQNTPLPLPHMGWNKIEKITENALFQNLGSDWFYFLHSYHFIPDDQSVCIAKTEYSFLFSSALNSDNIFATQFHPEKSHSAGIGLLKNFAEL